MMSVGKKEYYGLQVTLPNGKKVSISANWPHDSQQIYLAVDGEIGNSYKMLEVNREMLKREISKLVDNFS